MASTKKPYKQTKIMPALTVRERQIASLTNQKEGFENIVAIPLSDLATANDAVVALTVNTIVKNRLQSAIVSLQSEKEKAPAKIAELNGVIVDLQS